MEILVCLTIFFKRIPLFTLHKLINKRRIPLLSLLLVHVKKLSTLVLYYHNIKYLLCVVITFADYVMQMHDEVKKEIKKHFFDIPKDTPVHIILLSNLGSYNTNSTIKTINPFTQYSSRYTRSI